jgi:hypothetical protein
MTTRRGTSDQYIMEHEVTPLAVDAATTTVLAYIP